MNKNEIVNKYDYHEIPKKDKKIDGIDNYKPKYGYGVRHIQITLSLLYLTVAVFARGHIGVTIVAMTSHVDKNNNITNVTIAKNNTDDLRNSVSFNGTKTTINEEIIASINNASYVTEQSHKIYNWPKYIQEMILNAFYLGYLIMMFPMGIICQRYGGKLPMQISLLSNGIVSIATPWLITWGDWKAVCFCRLLQGLTQAGTYPSVQALLAKWAPTSERATLSSVVYTGAPIGTIVGYQLAGLLGASSWGWPSIYYSVGVICLICFILVTAFIVASPLEHKSITDEERNFIVEEANDGKRLKAPWRAIITSKPMWGIIIAQIGSIVSFVFFFIQVPSYIHYILGVNVKNSGILSSLPYLGSFFTSIGFGCVSDYCINRKYISRKNARRICSSISNCGLAFFLILTSYTSNVTIAVAGLVVTMMLYMALHAGWMVNFIDLAPNFSGSLIATSSIMSTFFILLTPVIVSQVVTDMTNVVQWRIMFFIIAGIAVITNVIFVLLISTDIQPWNNPDYNEKFNDKQNKEEE